MKISNEQIYDAIKHRLLEDLVIAYELFKEEGYEDLEGVILSINPSGNFGTYLKKHPDKMADFTDSIFRNIDFVVHIAFCKDSKEEFYPLISKK